MSDQDSALVISSGGCNVVSVEMAELVQRPVINVVALMTKQHAEKSISKRPDGKKLSDFADLILDPRPRCCRLPVSRERAVTRKLPGVTDWFNLLGWEINRPDLSERPEAAYMGKNTLKTDP